MSKHICKWCKNIISEDETIWNPDENGDGYHKECLEMMAVKYKQLRDIPIRDISKGYISISNIKRILQKYSGYLTADVWDNLMDDIDKYGEEQKSESRYS